MTIQTTVNGNSAEIALEGWLDTQTSPELGTAVDELDSSVTDIVLDFKKLDYISSAGLRQIVVIYKKVRSLIIRNVTPEIMEIFRMTGFDKRLNIQ